MKKIVGILLLVLFATGSVLPLYGATQTTIVLTIGSPVATVNGGSVTLDVAPFIKDSRTFVPLRFVSEQLGTNVTYTTKPDGTVDQVIIKMGSTEESQSTSPSSPETATENTNSWMLSDKQIMEALQVGLSLQTPDSWLKYEEDHYVQYAEGAGAPPSIVTVWTPYLCILQRAYLCQKNYGVVGAESGNYSFIEAKKDAQENSKVLPFGIMVYGASIDFCDSLKAVLILPNGSAKHPIYQDVPSLAKLSSSWPDYPAYQAACSFFFNTSQIGRNDTVTFVLIRDEGEQRAVIDLSKYK